MKNIDWDSAPAGFPIWLKYLPKVTKGDSHRKKEGGIWVCDKGDRYETVSGTFWTKPDEGYYTICERAKLKAPKDNGDGWIRHRGGKCPVEARCGVEVRYRDGEKLVLAEAIDNRWDHQGYTGDIMAYRIHKPAEQPCPVKAKAAERLAKFDPAKYVSLKEMEQPQIKLESGAEISYSPGEPLVSMEPADTMLAIRDRIRELDTQRAEVEATYQRQISEITQERESLVQKLAGEGLALVEGVVGPAEDMIDWRNWREGDLLTLVGGHISHEDFTSGNQYEFLRVDEWDEIVVIDDAGDENGYGVNSRRFKWHSRPAS